MKNKYFTKSSVRIILFNTLTMLLLYGVFNIFFFFLLNKQLDNQLDLALDHEIEHFIQIMGVRNDSIVFNNYGEFEERDLRDLTENPYFLQILDATGRIIYQSPNMRYISGIPIHFPLYTDSLTFDTYRIDNNLIRTGFRPIVFNGTIYGYIQLSTFKSSGKKILSNLLLFDLLSFPIVLLIILGIAYMNAQQYLAPIRKIIALARRISATDLSKRLDYKADENDEMGQLRDTLNHLFDRLDLQIRQIAQFTDNAAHQLMSPLTILKTELEFITRKEHTSPECRESFRVLIEQTDRMIHIVNTLLILAKEDSGHLRESSVINLQKVFSQLKNMYPERVILPQAKKGVFLRGNPDYFLMVLQNLIDNGLKYSPREKPVTVEIDNHQGQITIRVKDEGIGIPNKEKKLIFQRFYRGSNTDQKKGFGLGLSLVQSVVKMMGGKIKVHDNKPTGAIFELRFKELKLM